MTLRESSQIHAESIKQKDDAPPKILLKINSGYCLEVTGAILETQYTDRNRHLLFVTENIPFEETLHIYLVNSNLELIDYLSLSAIYSPGILENVSVIQPNKISFSFFDKQETWVLTIKENPKRLWWANKPPIRRHKPFLHKACLLLEKQ